MTPDELRALRDAATPGPWQIHSEGAYYDEWSGDAFWIGKDGKILGERKAWASALTAEDAALIALAPDLASLLADAMEALEAMTELAAVAHNGDPWYAEHEGLDASAIFQERRDFLAHFQALGDKS